MCAFVPWLRVERWLAVLVVGWMPGLAGADWPQFLGPHRNATSEETGLSRTWPAKGPEVVWEKKVGEGYSGPIVSGDTLILFHRVGNREVVEALEATTGKARWKFDYPTTYSDAFGKGDGPRATPVSDGKRVYTLGVEGALHALDLATGKKVWGRELARDYEMRAGFFGLATTPLLEGDHLLLNVGAKNAGIVAFHKDTGKEVWKATDDEASYASPVAATIAGVRHVVFFTRSGLVGLDPKDGTVRFTKPWRARLNASVNAATPLVIGDLLFLSASYQTGAIVLRVDRDSVKEVWKGDEILSNHYNTSVPHDGYLYGIDGRQEAGARLRCVALKTGEIAWTRERFGCASMIFADGQILALTEDGELVLFEANPEQYREKARAAVFRTPCRAELALSGGLLYGRDGEKLVCWKVKK